MATGRTKPTFAAAILTYAGLFIIAISSLSIVATLGVGLRQSVVGIQGGELQTVSCYLGSHWTGPVFIRYELHPPIIHVRPPAYEQASLVALGYVKSSDWMLRIPLWPICALIVLRFMVFVLWMPTGRRELAFRRLIRQFIGVGAALAIAVTVAVGLSALAQLIPDNDSPRDVLLRVVIPLIVSAVPASLALWWICRDRRPVDARICPECGYNLTGNVTGRCPECGTAIAIPIIAPPKS